MFEVMVGASSADIASAGKILLGSDLGDRVVLEIDGRRRAGVIEKIEYPQRSD
jgi:hypothetical protein